MISETMSSWERIKAAIELREVDRVPVVPYVYTYAAHYRGLSQAQVLEGNALQWPMRDLFDAVGGCDGFLWAPVDFRGLHIGGMPPTQGAAKWPGVDLPEDAVWQYEEREYMTVEDYDRIIEKGWKSYVLDRYQRELGLSPSGMKEIQDRSIELYRESIAYWGSLGAVILVCFASLAPMHILSLRRTFHEFTMDLFRRPEKVIAALEAIVDDLIEAIIDISRRVNGPAVLLALERGGGAFYSPKFFERFDLPYLRKLVDALISAGFIPVIYLETDWTLNLPYFKEFPKGKCLLGSDGTTDVFKAKEILRDHMCILGNVPPDLLQLGTVHDVESYCKRLIDVVGEGGGFIMGTGSEVPTKAKFENFKAMIDIVKTYPSPCR